MRKTILSLACNGFITLQDPSEPSVKNALRNLDPIGKPTGRRIPNDDRTPPSDLLKSAPKGWELRSVAQLLHLNAISDVKDGNHGSNHPKAAEFTSTGMPFITAAQVSDDGKVDYDAKRLSGEPLQKLRVGFAFAGDVIFTHKGSVGRVAICERDCVLSPQTTYYRLNPLIFNTHFFRYLLLSSFFQTQVDEVKRQTTRDFVAISKQYLFYLLVPPLNEQNRIASRIEKLLNIVDLLENTRENVEEMGERLARSSVAKLTGTETKDDEGHGSMKTPTTKLITRILLKKKVEKTHAPLAWILEKSESDVSAKELWRKSGLKIDAFYSQLKIEMDNGWISEPEKGYMEEVEAN